LQSPFLSRIGGSARVRDELTAALAEGRGVTAKVRWISGRNGDEEGRARWIHCTPLLGHNGSVGVWMIVVVDDDGSAPVRRFRQAPPVASDIGHSRPRAQELETDAMNFVNGYRENERADEYAKQSAVPTKHSESMAQREVSTNRNMVSPVPPQSGTVWPKRSKRGGAVYTAQLAANNDSQEDGFRPQSHITNDSLESFGLV
jgi:hypothetical protein